MFISVIIPAYNEEALLGPTLDAVNAALASCGGLLQGHEVIVVNDASTDQTASIAHARGAQVINVAKRQIAAARNAGAAAARGDPFIFVDADTIITADTLRGAIDALRAGAAGGGAIVRFDARVPLAARAAAWLLMRSFAFLRLAAGCFLFCSREAFAATGGFDEKFFASEEIWMSQALKKHGRFAMVRAPVTTSGRKIRMHGQWGLLWRSWLIMLRGQTGLQKREGLDLWYDGRRE